MTGSWNAYAIRYATRSESRRQEHFYRGDPCGLDHMPIDYFIWVLQRGSSAIVVDAGFTAETAQRRGAREMTCDIANVLEQLGAKPQGVSDLVLTHLHYDHTGNIGLFPNARIHLQRTEWEFWTGPYAQRGESPHLAEPGDLEQVKSRLERGQVQLHEGDAQIADGVSLHLLGGHTQGLQAVRVEVEQGTLVLASDASHFYENFGEDRPYSIVHHLPSMYDAFDWINATASDPRLIVPGHDPQVMDRFPAVPGLDGIAVQLA